MVESRDEVSNDRSIHVRQFQGNKTALGLYGVCTCGVASPKMMLQTVPNGGKTPNPAVAQPSQRPPCANSADGKCYAHSNHAAWRRLVLLGRGDQDRLSLVACNVHPTPSARRLFPPDPCRREDEGSNGGCCWLRHVSTVAPCVDTSSTYDLPGLSCLSRSVKLPSHNPLADSHASRVGVSDFPETSDCSRCSQAVLVQPPYDTGCKREAKRK